MSEIKAFIFDIGGVLETLSQSTWQTKWTERLQLTSADWENVNPLIRAGSIGEITELEFENRVTEIFHLTAEQRAELLADMWNDYLGELNVELYEAILSLKTVYKVALLSNSFVGAREREENKYNFSKLTPMISYSHETGKLKPDSQLILSLVWQIKGVQPNEVVFVDDNQIFVNSAIEAGLHGIRFVDNEQFFVDLESVLSL